LIGGGGEDIGAAGRLLPHWIQNRFVGLFKAPQNGHAFEADNRMSLVAGIVTEGS
jgi:hypothetical protein